ncbi:MAG: CPBP family intramembrane metalloprotease [Acidobacteria bacterium]|nr:CPBP family intramembrane metalloprotease [Acidobacteriota bacterium]
MDASRYLLLPDGRLRAGWRLLIFIVLYVIAGSLLAWLSSSSPATGSMAFVAATRVATVLVITWLMLRVFDRQPLLSVGLSPRGSALRELAAGLGIGLVLAEGVIVFEVATRLVAIEPAATADSAGSVALVSITGMLLSAAAWEELLFRGYPFQRLVEGTGRAAAIAITSLLFGLLHGMNPDATILSVMNTVLAGVLFSAAYLKTRALWLPIGLHFVWNWTLTVSGFPVSGLEIIQMPWRAVPASGSGWLYGGDYGPEGGIVTTVALFMAIAFLMVKVPGTGSAVQQPPAPAAGENGTR